MTWRVESATGWLVAPLSVVLVHGLSQPGSTLNIPCHAQILILPFEDSPTRPWRRRGKGEELLQNIGNDAIFIAIAIAMSVALYTTLFWQTLSLTMGNMPLFMQPGHFVLVTTFQWQYASTSLIYATSRHGCAQRHRLFLATALYHITCNLVAPDHRFVKGLLDWSGILKTVLRQSKTSTLWVMYCSSKMSSKIGPVWHRLCAFIFGLVPTQCLPTIGTCLGFVVPCKGMPKMSTSVLLESKKKSVSEHWISLATNTVDSP